MFICVYIYQTFYKIDIYIYIYIDLIKGLIVPSYNTIPCIQYKQSYNIIY